MLHINTQKLFTQMTKAAYDRFKNMSAKNLFNTLTISSAFFAKSCFKKIMI